MYADRTIQQSRIFTKFIVYEDCLETLFHRCPSCACGCIVTWHVIGTFVTVTQYCESCGSRSKWSSQPIIKNIPAGNWLLSAAIYFSGSSFAKINRVLSRLFVASISSSTFYSHVAQLLQPTILSVWDNSQQEMLDLLKQRPGKIIIGGDMRYNQHYCFNENLLWKCSSNIIRTNESMA